MRNINIEQHVSHRYSPPRSKIEAPLRKNSSLLSRAAIYRQAAAGTAFINTEVINQIKQKPSHIHKGHARKQQAFQSAPQAASRPFHFELPDFSALFEKRRVKTTGNPRVYRFSPPNATGAFDQVLPENAPGKAGGPAPKFAGFLLAPVLAVSGVLVFSLFALNWHNLDIGQNYARWQSAVRGLFVEWAAVPEPPADEGAMRNLAAYAGLSPEAAPAPAGEDIPLDLMETFAWASYKVRQGDSVSKIAAAHALSMDAIIASNSISNARRLRVGETIRLPNMDGIPYTVKNGDSISKISAAMGTPVEAILDANDIQNDSISEGTVLFIPGARMKKEDLKLALGELFIYPIRGRLTSPFGWRDDPISGVRRHHAALDLAAAMGTPIKAAMDGRVATVGYNSTYGNYIIITHGNAFQTMYAHLSRTGVKQGASVLQGSKIGEVGSTGYSTGPHLHFAVYKNGRAVNPLEYLNQ